MSPHEMKHFQHCAVHNSQHTSSVGRAMRYVAGALVQKLQHITNSTSHST